ncbi:MAG: amidohydrolase [Hadesarchaea archaeon]|nr:amidohydrolase [Hadesarchaea archaeon]
MIVDVHVHLGELGRHFQKWWMDELYGGFPNVPDREVRYRKDPVESLIEDLDQAGVDVACVMASDHRRPYPYGIGSSYTPNDYVAECVRKHPERFVGVCSFDPLRDPHEARKELERCVREWDMRALKLYPTYDHFDPRDERVFPIYEKAIELDLPVHFHMGYTGTINAPMKYQFPHLLDEVGIRFPEMKVIVAHMGFPWVDECLCLLMKHRHWYADIAYWGAFPPEFLIEMMKKFDFMCGYRRLLYGSENPWTATFTKTVMNLNEIAKEKGISFRISEADLRKIMGENARKLYRI